MMLLCRFVTVVDSLYKYCVKHCLLSEVDIIIGDLGMLSCIFRGIVVTVVTSISLNEVSIACFMWS